MPTSTPTNAIELCGQPLAISNAITIDSRPSNSTQPQPWLGLQAKRVHHVRTRRSRAGSRRSAARSTRCRNVGRISMNTPSSSVRMADRTCAAETRRAPVLDRIDDLHDAHEHEQPREQQFRRKRRDRRLEDREDARDDQQHAPHDHPSCPPCVLPPCRVGHDHPPVDERAIVVRAARTAQSAIARKRPQSRWHNDANTRRERRWRHANSSTLTGKVALVTGGSRGIGLQMAEALGEMGARVALTARKADELDAAASHLARAGHRHATRSPPISRSPRRSCRWSTTSKRGSGRSTSSSTMPATTGPRPRKRIPTTAGGA